MTVLAIIPAKSHSRRLPGKNLKEIGGWSLVDIAIQCALETPSIDSVIVSTDMQMLLPSIKFLDPPKPLMLVDRPPELCTDSASSWDVVWHAYWTWGEQNFPGDDPSTRNDILVLLQPTSIFRHSKDVEKYIEIYKNHKVANIDARSLCHYSTYKGMNGAVYVLHSSAMHREGEPTIPTHKPLMWAPPFHMPKYRSIDVDYASDFEEARVLYEHCITHKRNFFDIWHPNLLDLPVGCEFTG